MNDTVFVLFMARCPLAIGTSTAHYYDSGEPTVKACIHWLSIPPSIPPSLIKPHRRTTFCWGATPLSSCTIVKGRRHLVQN